MIKLKNMIGRVASGALVAVLACAWLGLAQAADPARSTRAPLAAANAKGGGKCVEPTDEMRRNHMNMILHQRDRTMHDGVRSQKHSLKNCIDCHADPKTNSVLGADGFCQSCHIRAAVSMDCFECHSPSPRSAASSRKPTASQLSLMPVLTQSTGSSAPMATLAEGNPR